ncbi:N-acetylmuramoyl-L-alanine amidase [Auritidibacter sp. NML100628]|uniref:N-acetylmuramoyl-L-alanine amidase n=1 Tax=Auritidibacter sp. NML100628 TaxID=2170742 RepID=UPI000D73837C|nr:N-acetylmuramoyl-L-alanine amidase [Auritidibacter sp. NML100628]PXA76156.1 hypothetical protein DCC24_08390 [Auritidibacter sp. NML100628]
MPGFTLRQKLTVSFVLLALGVSTVSPAVADTVSVAVHSQNATVDEPAETAEGPAEADLPEAEVRSEDSQVFSIDGVSREALPEGEEIEAETSPEPLNAEAHEEGDSPATNEVSEDPTESALSESAPTDSESTESELAEPEPVDADPSENAVEDDETVADQENRQTVTDAAEGSEPATDREEDHLSKSALDGESDEGELSALTVPLESIDFVIAGVTWHRSTSEIVTNVSIRVREQDGWSQWESLEIIDDAMAEGDVIGTEPLATTEADAVQVRVNTESGEVPSGLEITLIDPGVSDNDGAVVANTASHVSTSKKNPSVGRPTIVRRSQWGANESWVSPSKQSSTLKAMYVHHTAGTNNYSRSQAYAQVRGIYSYHARTLDWGDIGYHFLVDRYGTIYEGRKGSMDSLPIGAQAGGFNTDTIGVSAIGNFEAATPPTAMVNSLTRVLAWKAHQYDLNPQGKTTLVSRASPGSTARYKSGTRVSSPVILGHRRTNATACPGARLNALLPSIRSNASSKVSKFESSVKTYQYVTSSGPMRAGTSSKTRRIGTVPAGERVHVLGTKGSWTQVVATVGTGWVPSRVLSDKPPKP